MEADVNEDLLSHRPEVLLAAAEYLLQRDLEMARQQEERNDSVEECIEAAIEHVREADFALYASYK